MRSWQHLCASVAVLATGALGASVVQAETVRACMDPDNLPFSKEVGPVKGLYVELAEMIGQKLESPIQYVWWLTYNQRKAMRNTVNQGECDVMFAVPTSKAWHARGLERSTPVLNLSYVLIAPPDLSFTRLEDLRNKKVGVQFQTNPHVMMAMQEGYTTKTYRTADELLAGLARGEVDAGMLWGPEAGYENKAQFNSRWKITPLSGDDFEGGVSIAVRKELAGLKTRIDAALEALRPEIAALAEKYGIPSGAAVDMSQYRIRGASAQSADKTSTTDKPITAAKAPAPLVAGEKPAQAEPLKVAATGNSSEDMLKAGTVRFNDICAHCHGTNAIQFVKPRDLRRLKSRYKADWENTARETIRNGLPDLGMPTWKGILSDQQLEEILAFLRTVQS